MKINTVCTTVFGAAVVTKTARIDDDVVELRLRGWTLANGKHPTLFAPESKLKLAALGGAAGAEKACAEEASEQCGTPATGKTTLGGDVVELLNDEHFSRIRVAMGVPTNVLATRGQWKFEDLKASGGKGGDMMGRSCGSTFGRFFVKEVSGGDHDTLLKIADKYADHIVAPGGSFICRFFMHVRHEKSGKFYVVMNNWIPSVKAVSEGKQTKLERPHDEYQYLYDLKGAADDKTQRRDSVPVTEVHMRCWHCRSVCREYACGPSICGVATPSRKAYRDGKTHAFGVTFAVAADQRRAILARIEKDTAFLTKLGLMDYSLIVGVKRANAGSDADELRAQGGFLQGDSADQPFQVRLNGGDEIGYYIGVIDFLQEWTLKKSLAHCLKTLACAPKPLATVHPKEYGERFMAYFQKKFVARGTASGGSSGGTDVEAPGSDLTVVAVSDEGAIGSVAGASKGDEGVVANPGFVEISLS